jgi:predicted ATP-dependent Lon-type protease
MEFFDVHFSYIDNETLERARQCSSLRVLLTKG